MAANFTKWFPSGFRLILGDTLSKWFNNPQFSFEDTITAKAGGGQAGAYPITACNSRISVCASGNDSVKLPLSDFCAGGEFTIINDGAQAAKVFSNKTGGATIDGVAGATGVALSAANRATFYCLKAGNADVGGVWVSFGGGKSS